jgi:predicted Zn-dependent protease
MQKLLKSRSGVPTFLSTHPATSDRIQSLERAIKAEPGNGNAGLDKNAYQANIRSLLRS